LLQEIDKQHHLVAIRVKMIVVLTAEVTGVVAVHLVELALKLKQAGVLQNAATQYMEHLALEDAMNVLAAPIPALYVEQLAQLIVDQTPQLENTIVMLMRVNLTALMTVLVFHAILQLQPFLLLAMVARFQTYQILI